MTIFYDNKAVDATITSTNEDPNFPLSNTIHRYLSKVYRATGNSDTITIEFSDVLDIDCIVVDYQNLSALTAKLYGADTSLLDTQVLTPSDIMHYFTQVDNVKKIELIVTTSALYVEIGGIGAGLKLEMPSARINYKRNINDRSRGEKTEGGQLNGRRIRKLRGYNFSIDYVDLDTLDEIIDLINEVQKVKTFWFDLFESSHTRYEPFYASITRVRDATRIQNGIGYNFQFSVEESF